ncbi:protein translocase subunit SecD [Rhodopirellula bahusiensis]|uniref:Multifunctional fusion protein n=2 Tax=Rhodopirellula bahusiensis TaxID=2014065 RepID=A0A2G1W1N0_9BACT|nr:protein translocase subunit SecD [Rhodopirellula bahusiensis]PHQ32947.1 protein translocase subunit SecDF [Rhodopirellula bahusiensis]
MDLSTLPDLCHSISAQWLAQTDAAVASEVSKGISTGQIVTLLSAAAVLILPFIVGNFLAKSLKMPTYGTRFGFILLAITASGVTLANKFPSLGIDLSGGTILVYELDPEKQAAVIESGGQRITSEDLVGPLTRRINPAGTQEIVIRPYGEQQIEIIIPEKDPDAVDRIKGLVEEAGQLRFAILANQFDHQTLINQAIEQAESTQPGIATRDMVGKPDDSLYGIWARIGFEEKETDGVRPMLVPVSGALARNPRTGAILNVPPEARIGDESVSVAKWLKTQDFDNIEVLMVINPKLDILGEDLAYAASTFDETGAPAVAFTLTDMGSGRFRALTTNNAPDGSRTRQLGIVLDDELLSAPSIQEPMNKNGRITGNFTRDQVDSLVQILKAGQLPATVTKQPIAENEVGATLGADTRTKGLYSIAVSLGLVLIFILVYYRFAGVVACIALVMNMAMILATMVFINQPLTLPGLAGLVLTVGMSVDANVLIFERIREELNKGAKARMAIRNGFARATTTIIDANLTTLITAIVLYAIGTDQIRGFAVTLILGILYSMFTAIYVSRTIFDLAERRGFLSLGMSDGVNSIRSAFAGGGQFNFISKGKMTLTLSAILVVCGLAALFARGQSILDIDFAGGSSVQFRVDQPTEADEVRKIMDNAVASSENDSVQFTVNGVSMEGAEEGTVFKVDSSVERVEDLKQVIREGFAASESVGLVTYSVDITPADLEGATQETAAPDTDETSSSDPAEPSDSATSQWQSADNGVMLVIAQDDEEEAPVEEAEAEETTDAESDGPKMEAREFPGLAFSTTDISLGIKGSDKVAVKNEEGLVDSIVAAAEAVGVPIQREGIIVKPLGEDIEAWSPGSTLAFPKWRVQLPLGGDNAIKVMGEMEKQLDSDPVWISSSAVGARVAGDMISRAFGALFASLLCIIGYIWFRFQRVIYGLAAVVALLHDVAITLGAIAISYWVADALGFLLIDPFKISLTVVAALLTIIGYSLNDTIVVFDRIRETKGKAPRLTGEMINTSINQTLSRTLLTSLTTLIVVALLYAFGGEGIHAFAFALVIGVIVGTYSSVFVASPVLLWLVEREEKKAANA